MNAEIKEKEPVVYEDRNDLISKWFDIDKDYLENPKPEKRRTMMKMPWDPEGNPIPNTKDGAAL